MISIYKLINPETNAIFYVGRSKNAVIRLYTHCTNPQTRITKELKSKDLQPCMEIIESVSEDKAAEREAFWISKLFEDGHQLENKTIINTKIYPEEILWLKTKQQYLHILVIERQIGLPTKTLYNFCIDYASLNERWWEPVQNWVNKFRTIKPIEK